MKKQTLPILSLCFLLVNKSFSQFVTPPIPLNNSTQVTGGSVGIGTIAPAAKLDVLNAGNQLRLSYSSSLFSDIQTTASGYLYLNPYNGTAGRIGLGTSNPDVGFHSNMGSFKITDPTSTIRGFQIIPSRSAIGDIPSGTTLLSSVSTTGEGLSIATCGSGADGVKLGAYAYSQINGGWKSMWETQNVFSGTPNLSLVKNGGNVGIGTGTTAPQSHLDIKNAALSQASGAQVEWQQMYGSSGTNTDYLKVFHKRYTGGSNWNSSEIKIQKKMDATDMHYISFRGSSTSSSLNFGWGNNDFMSISDIGQVAIGTMKVTSGPHTNALLTVSGKVDCKEVRVFDNSSGYWADFVFEKNYKLMPLLEVENYYNTNKHLPNIPTAKEIETEGNNLAKTDALLLQKIEELTLYIVQQQKDIETLKKEIHKE